MAAVLALCLTVLTVVNSGLAMHELRQRPQNRVSKDFLANYINERKYPVFQNPREVQTWPGSKIRFGQVAGVDVTPDGDVMVFHRGDRPWLGETFDLETNVMPESQRVNISQDTIVRVKGDTGEVVDSFGHDMYYVPHGLTVDKGGNLWLTDVGTHQVFRIPRGQTEPDLTLGEKFIPGNDDDHFCKPTDIAVASNGDFFVSDGYCNSRVLKFSSSGRLLGKFGMNVQGVEMENPYGFHIPHSLALIEELDILCVADRENLRVLCFDAGLGPTKLGQFNRTIVPQGEVGRVYGLAYDPNAQVMYVAALLSQEMVWEQGFRYSPARAFTYSLNGKYLGGWGYIPPDEAELGPSIPHDIAVSPDGNDVYIADVMQEAVHKFTQSPANRKHFG